MVFSPLEQFQIYPIFQLSLGLFDISITNAAVLFLLTIFSTLFLLYSLGTENTMFLVPNRVQYFFELLYETTSDLLSGIVGPTGKYYFP
jgi:F-type H+-transporting ATPase subunit a